MARIIHLSDFHLNSKTLTDWNNFLEKALLEILKEIDKENSITLIAFTGDLIDKGGIDFQSIDEGFDQFKTQVIEKILDHINLDINRFIITPGNHDVIRSKDSQIVEKGLRKHFSDNYENVTKFIDNILNSGSLEGVNRMHDYNKFERSLYDDKATSKSTFFESSFIIETEEHLIGVSSFNSSWRCYDEDDKGRLLIGDVQIAKSLKIIENCPIKIALMHHSFEWLSELERQTIKNHLAKDYDVLLVGHVHEGFTNLDTNFVGSLFINTAPSGINNLRSDSRKFSNGFTVIDFDKDNSKIACKYYRYNHKNKSFQLNEDLAERGYLELKIPAKKSKTLIELEKKILSSIQEDHFTSMDNHLISKKAPLGPSNIKDAFILPPIEEGYSPSDTPHKTNIDINFIIKSNQNLMLVGSAESSKTTMLYRLVVEYFENYQVLNRIPVYINFEEIGNKRIETVIREYLGCAMNDVYSLLKNNRLVLLVDNLNFNREYNQHNVNKINTFNHPDNYEKIRIIATSEDNITGIYASEYLEKCNVPFKNYFIRDLKSAHIKKMIQTWMPENYDKAPQDFVDKLIGSFHNYALPSTAMSVSLYIWSLENKERKPINHAVLLEIYIEIMLEKLSEQNIYRGKFDFTNKMQLLAKIAHDMYLSDGANYSILYSKFIQIIELYLNDLVGFDLDAKRIAEYFVERKIFVKYQTNRIKFSYSCFFHFFLSQRMVYDDKFKTHVLKEEHYLKFHKEIDYYTALTRSDSKLLQEMHERITKEFESIVPILKEINVDEYFTNLGDYKFEPKAREIEVNMIRENRPSEKMIEEFQNKKLKEIPDASKIMKKKSSKSKEQLLILFCNVLRNSEGVEDLNLKKDSYNTLVRVFISWMILYREYIIEYVIKHKRYPYPIPSEYELFYVLRSVPYHCQLGFFKQLGTPKLAPVILEKIKNDLNGNSITSSDVELYLSTALYTDIKGKDFDIYFKALVKKVGNNAVRDYCLYKLIDYYYKRTKPGSSNEKFYLDLLADLRIKSQSTLTKRMKEKVIKKLEDSKNKFLNESA